MRFLLDGEPRLLYSVGDVATDPSVRGLGGRRGVYRAMTEAFYDAVGPPACRSASAFPNARALKVSERIVGSRTLFPIALREVPVDAFAPPPPDAGGGRLVGRGLRSALGGRPAPTSRTRAVRDRARVNWRFHARPTPLLPDGLAQAGRRADGLGRALRRPARTPRSSTSWAARPTASDLPALFAAAADEARRLGARRLVVLVDAGRPGPRARSRRCPGERRDAGFPMIVRVFDEAAVATDSRERVHLVPSLYDLV